MPARAQRGLHSRRGGIRRPAECWVRLMRRRRMEVTHDESQCPGHNNTLCFKKHYRIGSRDVVHGGSQPLRLRQAVALRSSSSRALTTTTRIQIEPLMRKLQADICRSLAFWRPHSWRQKIALCYSLSIMRVQPCCSFEPTAVF